MRRLPSLGACFDFGFDSSTVYGSPIVSASRIASPICASSSVVRYRSRPSSGKYSIPRQGLKPTGTTWALAAKVNRLLKTRSSRFAWYGLARACCAVAGFRPM